MYARRGVRRTPEPNQQTESQKTLKNVPNSWTDSFENVDSFKHEIFAAARTKTVTFTYAK